MPLRVRTRGLAHARARAQTNGRANSAHHAQTAASLLDPLHTRKTRAQQFEHEATRRVATRTSSKVDNLDGRLAPERVVDGFKGETGGVNRALVARARRVAGGPPEGGLGEEERMEARAVAGGQHALE
eukprot:4615964-Pleurochrysis_carterae.AAC.4